jgi:hypothetical protein
VSFHLGEDLEDLPSERTLRRAQAGRSCDPEPDS